MDNTIDKPVPDGSHWREKYRVRISFFFAVLFVWRAQPRFFPFLVLGIAFGFLGILLRQWAAGCVRKNDELARTGPYAIVRHPLYLGSFMAAAGLIFAASTFHVLAVSKPFLDRTLLYWCFLFAMADSVYLPKIRGEEKLLREKFGEAYEDYARSVPRVIPRSLRREHLDFTTFSRELYLKNKEYASVLGYGLLSAVLIARYFIR